MPTLSVLCEPSDDIQQSEVSQLLLQYQEVCSALLHTQTSRHSLETKLYSLVSSIVSSECLPLVIMQYTKCYDNARN